MKNYLLGAAFAALLSGCVSPAQRAKNQEEIDASVPYCQTEKQCKVEWEAAATWVSQHCGMKIQTSTDSLIQTFNSPPNSPTTSCTVTKVQGPGHQQAFTVHVGCANIFGCVPNSKDMIIAFGTALKEAGAPFQPLHVGVQFQAVDSQGRPTVVLAESMGLAVKAVENGGRAKMAGLLQDDVVTGMNDKRIRTLDDWTDTLAAYGPGDVVTLKVRRAGRDELVQMPL